MSDEHVGSGAFVAGIVLWFVLACALGASGRLSAITPPWPQAMIGAITLAIVLTGALHPGLRAWLAHVNLRGFVAFHVTRFIGIAFLVLSARGELSRAWAIPAGWGDIVVALGALLIALIMRDPQARPGLLGLWNVVGFADIVLVVVTAARTINTRPSARSASSSCGRSEPSPPRGGLQRDAKTGGKRFCVWPLANLVSAGAAEHRGPACVQRAGRLAPRPSLQNTSK